jgi:hypothetical protein
LKACGGRADPPWSQLMVFLLVLSDLGRYTVGWSSSYGYIGGSGRGSGEKRIKSRDDISHFSKFEFAQFWRHFLKKYLAEDV